MKLVELKPYKVIAVFTPRNSVIDKKNLSCWKIIEQRTSSKPLLKKRKRIAINLYMYVYTRMGNPTGYEKSHVFIHFTTIIYSGW